jgi:hypothetical protein
MWPWQSLDGAALGEPMTHMSPVRSVSRIAIGLQDVCTLSVAARRVHEAALLDFFEAPSPILEVHFQAEHDSSIDCRPDLPLVFSSCA